MVVDDFNVPASPIAPDKTYPPLIIDADAVLSSAIRPQRLQVVAGRDTEIVQLDRRIDNEQLGASPSLNLLRQIPNAVACKDRCRALFGEALDHGEA